MTLHDYIGKLQRGIANLSDELREQQATIDRMTPVYDYACRLAELWDTRYDTLPSNNQEMVRLAKKSKEAERNENK